MKKYIPVMASTVADLERNMRRYFSRQRQRGRFRNADCCETMSRRLQWHDKNAGGGSAYRWHEYAFFADGVSTHALSIT